MKKNTHHPDSDDLINEVDDQEVELDEEGELVNDAGAQKTIAKLEQELAEVQASCRKAEETAQRSLADYQNVVRRSQEDKMKFAKMAARDVVLSILLPLDHLFLAKEQLKDHGLNMVHQQFIQALSGQGVQEIEAVGQPFDENTMEVIDKRQVNDKLQDGVVLAVTQRGYTLHGEVIRHAKVVIGTMQ